MYCRKCGKQIPDDSEFCYKCGAPVVITVNKSQANRAVKEPLEDTADLSSKKLPSPIIQNGKKVCPKCGYKVTGPWCTHCGIELFVETSNVNSREIQAPKKQEVDLEKNSEPASGAPVLVIDNLSKQNVSTVTPTKENPVQATERQCVDCGKIITSPVALFCPYCSGELISVKKFGKESSIVKSQDSNEKILDTPEKINVPKDKLGISHTEGNAYDYDRFKSILDNVIRVIIGIVVFIMILTGAMSCTDFGEVSATYDVWGVYIIIVIVLFVVRGIILACYKHK